MMTFPFIPLASALVEFAPLIGRWIKGDQGEQVAQKIVETARSVTGQQETLKVLQQLKVDGAALLSFQQAMLRLDQELEMADYKDRESARLRDIALVNAGRSNYRADIMVVAAAVGLVACLVTITVYQSALPGEAVGIISTIAGIFGACLKDAYAFEFGSSRGSKIKDSKLSALVIGK